MWFVWKDATFVLYSEPKKLKLRNLEQNSKVSFAIDDTKGGDDVVRFEGTARASVAVVVTPTKR